MGNLHNVNGPLSADVVEFRIERRGEKRRTGESEGWRDNGRRLEKLMSVNVSHLPFLAPPSCLHLSLTVSYYLRTPTPTMPRTLASPIT
ncbi:hypothetical protein SRHO_G00113880 [Serrasalmus rhombeus]